MAEVNIEDINREAIKDPLGFIERADEEYFAHIKNLAKEVHAHKAVRIILIAGPSGSGKTTTANLLMDSIRELSEECMVVSLDDFYRNSDDPEYPRDKNGERNFESVDALDLPLLVKTLTDIADGRRFFVPKYDFKSAHRTDMREYPDMSEGCVIIEGLHALNPKIFEHLPREAVYKIFISVSTNINKGAERILSGRKIRFLRRMIRDSIYRNATAQKTLEMWRGVLVGEDKYLYPNRKYADISFNTFHAFELSVMRPFAEDLISEELAERDPYARTVLEAVRSARPISIDIVPETSLIREFIPGGKYESVY